MEGMAPRRAFTTTWGAGGGEEGVTARSSPRQQGGGHHPVSSGRGLPTHTNQGGQAGKTSWRRADLNEPGLQEKSTGLFVGVVGAGSWGKGLLACWLKRALCFAGASSPGWGAGLLWKQPGHGSPGRDKHSLLGPHRKLSPVTWPPGSSARGIRDKDPEKNGAFEAAGTLGTGALCPASPGHTGQPHCFRLS